MTIWQPAILLIITLTTAANIPLKYAVLSRLPQALGMA